VHALLYAGANPNLVRTDNSASSVFMAAQLGHCSVVRALLTAGASPTWSERIVVPALSGWHTKAATYVGVVAALLKADTDPNLLTRSDRR
jgi:hypothetical protein